MASASLGGVRRNRFAIPLQMAALIFALAAAVSWGLWWHRGVETTLNRAQRTGEIRIGYAVEPPYAYVERGVHVTGESPEIAKLLVKRLGIERIVWVQTTFDALIPELELGRFDLIAAGMHITKPRAARVAFTRPTFQGRPALLVLHSNPRQLHTCADVMADSGIRIAVLSGAVEFDALQACGVPRSQLLVVPDALAGRAAVESHLADGLALTELAVRWMVVNSASHELEMVVPFECSSTGVAVAGYSGLAVRKSDADLLQACDRILADYLGTPEHRKLVAGFGFADGNLPGPATVEELLRR